MIKVAIVEDEEAERKRIKNNLQCVAEEKRVIFDIDEFPSALAFFARKNLLYDIVLMDIEMPGMDGLSAARKFREQDKTAVLIFITNMAQYAVKGYEVEALDFIVKPIKKYDFTMKLGRAVEHTQKRGTDALLITVEGEKVVLSIPSIRYVETMGHSVIYNTLDGTFTEFATLKSVEKRINRSSFAKCNRCYYVNLRYVNSVKDNIVCLGKDELILARTQRKSFLNALSDFIGGGV
jgi:DNA-binding LytR/AlgR family response regulator